MEKLGSGVLHAVSATLEEVFYVRSVPWCYKQHKSSVQWIVRQSPASKNANIEAEEATALEAVTRPQPVKIQQTEKT
jgi:hypothetical protein